MQRFLTTRDFIWHDDLFLPRMGPVIGLFLSRGPSSFFRRVGAVPSTIIISQNDAATTKDLWKRSLSLSLSRGIALAETRPLYRGQSDFEWPQVHTGLDPSVVWLFFSFFFGRKPDRPKPDVESIDSLAIYRAINLSGRIYLGFENIRNARASLFDDRRKRKRRSLFPFFFFNLANIESIPLDSFTGSILLIYRSVINPSEEFISSRKKNIFNARSLTFMLIAGNVRDSCRNSYLLKVFYATRVLIN